MTEQRGAYDRAAMALGVAALVAVVFALADGKFRFVTVRDWAILVLVVIGVGGIIAGWRALPTLATVIGVLSIGTAVLQVVLVGLRANWLGGSINTASFWLGLGIGFLIVGLLPRARVSEPDRAPNPTSSSHSPSTS